jgi:hypothetical protein
VVYQFKNRRDGKIVNHICIIIIFFIRGGFLLIPHTIEFYQGQTNRLSDRIQFRRASDKNIPLDPTVTHQGTHGWVFERLSP